MFGNAKSVKCAISTHLETLNLDFYKFLHILKAELYQIDRIQSPKIAQKSFLEDLEVQKVPLRL